MDALGQQPAQRRGAGDGPSAISRPRTQPRRWRSFEFVEPESGERLPGPDAEPGARTEEERSEGAAPSAVG
ncbi:hypothetical protein [Streptomyces lavendulocolor]|uniref:hypothetical protein n=1 Tax=Streptomyces lavendulocolor TaxID=67316 RepID=UPI0033CA0E99